MNIMQIRITPTVELINLLNNNNYSIEDKNLIIYELTYRMYIPFNEENISFDDLLLRNGYTIEQEKEKKKTL